MLYRYDVAPASLYEYVARENAEHDETTVYVTVINYF